MLLCGTCLFGLSCWEGGRVLTEALTPPRRSGGGRVVHRHCRLRHGTRLHWQRCGPVPRSAHSVAGAGAPPVPRPAPLCPGSQPPTGPPRGDVTTDPSQTVPSQTVPSQTIPSQTVLSQTVPSQTVPSQTDPARWSPVRRTQPDGPRLDSLHPDGPLCRVNLSL